MVSAIQSNEEGRPRFAPSSFRQNPADESIRFNDLALAPTPGAEKDPGFQAFGDDGFTVLDALDVINPLQHLPIVGPLYRELTGDDLDPFSRIAGSTLFFGPLGTVVSSANVAIEEFTGRDMGGHLIALMKDHNPEPSDIEIASLTPSAAGTDDIDPVTAWAMGEISYRKAEADRQGLAMPAQPYSSLIANAAPDAQNLTSSVTLSQWSPPLDSQKPLTAEVPQQPQTQAPPVIVPRDFLAVNEAPKSYQASSATLERLRQTTDAYRAASVETDALIQNDINARPNTADKPQAALTESPTPHGAMAADGGWFTATMVEALSKYRQIEEIDKPKQSEPSLVSTLH